MPRHFFGHGLIIAAVTVGWPCSAAAADYSRDVRPLLERRCIACHGPLKQEANLRLDSGNAIRAGGESGPAVVPNSANGSILLQRVTAPEVTERMPPEGAPLSAEEIRALTEWIEAGAISPADERPLEDPRHHWAFCKPVRPAVPSKNSAESNNPVDSFIEVELQTRGLEPLPTANKTTLLRRVYLDLIGIPPTRDELRQFLADSSANAYEKVVDHLLQNPAYGERWGRHWMDVWRYSDWYGRRAVPDVMNSYPQIWRWRDWIVSSLNEDKGYDRMVQEMLAADELCPGDNANVVATGFLVRNWFKWNYENWMKDNVEHTAKAFLGLTINCAHCHDHKFDPISQEDYFRFRAAFEPLELRQDRVPGLPDPGAFKKYVYAEAYGPIAAGLIRVFDEKLDAQTFMYEKGDARNRMAGKPPVEPGIPQVFDDGSFHIEPVRLPVAAYYPGSRSELRADDTAQLAAQFASAERKLAASQATLVDARTAMGALRLAAGALVMVSGSPAAPLWQVSEQAVCDVQSVVRTNEQLLVSLQAQLDSLNSRIAADDARNSGQGNAKALAQAASQAERRAAYEEARLQQLKAEAELIAAQRVGTAESNAKARQDNAQQKLADTNSAIETTRGQLTATSDSYTALSPVYPSQSTGRRLALANWIANSQNPLTARVAVNHIWMRHFGRGLVDTPSNFGRSGHRPSHPELLDWLSVELMEHGWRMKHVHRLIVTSATYCRLSNLGDQGDACLAIDPDNVYYWRASTRRMEAEVVRDSLLACAGELDSTLGGQELDPAQGMSSRRRSLYFAIHGEGKMQFLDTFDAPDVCDCYQRPVSVRPQQALALANSELTLELSRILAARLWQAADKPESDGQAQSEFLSLAFETILSRQPTAAEQQAASEFLQQQQTTLQAANAAERTVQSTEGLQPPSADIAQRARETMIHALFNHNDFVTVR